MRKITFGQFLVLALGLLAALAFITGVHGWQRDGSLLHYHGWERLIALIGAAFCIAWFVSLRRRVVWGWYVGCVLLIMTIVQFFVIQGLLIFVKERANFLGWWALISQTLCALIPFFILTKWWMPKKREFFSRTEPNQAMKRIATD